MTHVRRLHHVGINVIDLQAAIEFFSELGFELEGTAHMEGEFVESVIGLTNVNDDLAMMRIPGGGGCVELIKFHTPVDDQGPEYAPANRLGLRHIALTVEDINGLLDKLRGKGFETIGQVRDHEDIYRVCFLRGPEGIIVELAEELSSATAR